MVGRRSSRLRSHRNTVIDENEKDAPTKINEKEGALVTHTRKSAAFLADAIEEEKKEEYVRVFHFQGVDYGSYEEMVRAKRQRNHKMLVESGLLQASQDLQSMQRTRKRSSEEEIGIKSAKKKTLKEAVPLVRRKSNRLAGIPSGNRYVESESGGKFTLSGTVVDKEQRLERQEQEEERFFRGRINDGSALTLSEAVRNIGSKWYQEDSLEKAQNLFSINDLTEGLSLTENGRKSKDIVNEALDELEVTKVAKVVPDRIYSVCFHPTRLLACAGDKTGFMGLWDVKDDNDDKNQDVILMKTHNGAISHMEWNDNNQLLSASYDGTIRLWDAASSSFRQIFATYDDSPRYKHELGFDMETDGRFWMQYACFAQNYNNLLFSTSHGTVGHIDLRQPKLSFYKQCSDKKINTVSLHPDGRVLATAGLDTTVQLWDIRMFGSNSEKKKNVVLNSFSAGKSVNSAFFSPNGRQLLTTTMANTCDILNDFHLNANQQTKRIRHDNLTGRWLSTFMARWHPTKENIFVVGSMNRPRMIDVYSSKSGSKMASVTGESMTAVASRCCFHPHCNEDVLVGGNSSGRMVIAQRYK